MGSSGIPVILGPIAIGFASYVLIQRRRKAPDGKHRLWRSAGSLPLSVGLAVSLCAAAPVFPARGAGATATGTSTSRQGYISIAGGVKLAYDLTLPAAVGRFPVALEYNDYTAGTDNSAEVPGSDAGDLLAAGFAVLGVNEPGSGCSGGVNDIADANEWGSAGAQVVEWAAAQSWSSGHVGMFGSSWTGITQLGVASFRPKGLDAITPFHILGDLYQDWAYPGGVFNSTFVTDYSAGLVSEDAQTAEPRIKSGDQQCSRNFDAHVQANKKYTLAANALAHPFDDAYWKASPASGIGRINVPVLGCQSWQDGVASSRAAELYSDAFNKKTSWFVGMNGPHGICESGQPLSMMVNFLRHYVAGADNGWQKTPHITILHQVSAATSKPAWTSTYNSWSTAAKPVALDFHADGSLTTHPATTAGTSSFSGPSPSQSGSWTAAPAHGTSVSYTTPPLAHDADFLGPASVNLWLSTYPGPRDGEPLIPDAPDTDIEVILSEVRPDGKEQYVQAGWLDVAQRNLAPAGNGPRQSTPLRPYQTHTQASYQPLTPNAPVYARVELFPFEHVFRAGSSIRITIDSAMGAVQSNGYWGLTGLPGPVKDTIYATPARQSQIVLGLTPGSTAKAPLPACNTIAGEPCRPNAAPVPPGRLTIT
jgi:putative CocE/NonD family hydrolase